jgi:hypothetical protein
MTDDKLDGIESSRQCEEAEGRRSNPMVRVGDCFAAA